MYKSIFKAFGVVAVTVFFCVECGGGARPSNLVGRWVDVSEDKKTGHASYDAARESMERMKTAEQRMIEKSMELLKDGTGIIAGNTVSWKVKNKRLIITSQSSGIACGYNVSGYMLTLTNDAGETDTYVRRENLEEFKP